MEFFTSASMTNYMRRPGPSGKGEQGLSYAALVTHQETEARPWPSGLLSILAMSRSGIAVPGLERDWLGSLRGGRGQRRTLV